MRRRSLLAGVVVLLQFLVLGAVHAQSTFTYTGTVQTYTVPPGAVGITITARGAGGGGGGADAPHGGGNGGAGALAAGTFPVAAGTLLNVFVGGGGGSAGTSNQNTLPDNGCALAEGRAGVAAGGYGGGLGARPGCSYYSGGGGGGGAASGVALNVGNAPILIAGGGSGGQGDSLGGAPVNGLISSATGNITSPSAGGAGATITNADGGGGGGGGGGCPGGAGGLFKPDNTDPVPNTPAGAGSSCRRATVTGFSVTGGGGASGGNGALAGVLDRGLSGSATAGGNGQVIITPIFPSLAVVKSLGVSPMLIRTNNYYNLTVTNTAAVAASSATVQDQLPPGMTYLSAAGSAAGWSCLAGTPDSNGTLVTCTFAGTIAATNGTSVLRINGTPTTSSSKTNRASVDPTGGITPPTALSCTGISTPSPGCAAPVVTTLTELNILKSQPSPALAVGSNSTYSLTVTNSGTGPASSATVQDQLPANLSFVSAAGTNWSCSNTAGLVTCTYTGSVAAGASAPVISVVVTPTDALTVTNRASVDPTGGTNPPGASSCNTATQNSPTAGCAAQVVSGSGRAVSGTVYNDANHNGVLDGAESGAGGSLFVKLSPSSGSVCSGPATLAVAVNSSTGTYNLSSVLPGNYCLVLDGNSTLSDISPATPAGRIGTQNASGLIQITVGGFPVAAQNFGFYNGARLSGNVFADTGLGAGTANNGVKDGAESGLGAVQVSALQGASVIDSTSTAGDGSYTLWLPAGTGAVAIAPAPAGTISGYLATGGSAGSPAAGGAYVRPTVTGLTPVPGQIYSGVNFGLVPPNTMISNGVQAAQPGTVVFYAHTFTAGSAGSVNFTLAAAATPSGLAWSQVLYLDSNCNATLDAGEPVISAAINVTAGQNVCLVVKQQVPAGAPAGAQNNVTLTAAMSYTNAAPALASTLTLADLTTVNVVGGLGLGKQVANPPGSTAAINIIGKAGDTLEYLVTAVNNGSQPISALVINDATPPFTTFVLASCPAPAALPAGITACSVSVNPAVGATGGVQWTFTGSLAPSAQVRVTYQTKINQ